MNELGRLPLAIQVAGGLLAAEAGRGLGVTELLEDIRKGTAVLKAQAPADMADLVHETIPTVLALLMKSVDCLDEETRSRFPCLAPFVPKPASFGLSALAYVSGVEDPKPTVRALVDFGLIEPTETEGRYHTHAIITKLAAHLAKDDIEPWMKHADYYALLTGEANDTYRKGKEGVLRGLAVFDTERDNIEAGRQWAADNAAADNWVAELCVDYALRCPHLLSLRLHPKEQILWMESARQCARRLKHRQSEGAALGNLGNAYQSLGEYHRAIELYEQRLEIAREIGDRRGEGNALGNLGNAYQSLGDYRRAIELYAQRLEIAREIGDRRGEGNALGNWSLALDKLGERDKAIELTRQALVIFEQIGSPYAENARKKLAEWQEKSP